jgi:hypothetical protein
MHRFKEWVPPWQMLVWASGIYVTLLRSHILLLVNIPTALL